MQIMNKPNAVMRSSLCKVNKGKQKYNISYTLRLYIQSPLCRHVAVVPFDVCTRIPITHIRVQHKVIRNRTTLLKEIRATGLCDVIFTLPQQFIRIVWNDCYYLFFLVLLLLLLFSLLFCHRSEIRPTVIAFCYIIFFFL